MAAAYQTCRCRGIEWELYDRTAADGPRKTLCLGVVVSRHCYQFMEGPAIPCARRDRKYFEKIKERYRSGRPGNHGCFRELTRRRSGERAIELSKSCTSSSTKFRRRRSRCICFSAFAKRLKFLAPTAIPLHTSTTV